MLSSHKYFLRNNSTAGQLTFSFLLGSFVGKGYSHCLVNNGELKREKETKIEKTAIQYVKSSGLFPYPVFWP